MALTNKEKELLAVVKYFNSELANKHIARLVTKLNKDFGWQVTCELTGFEKVDVEGFALSIPPRKTRKDKLGPTKATKKIQEDLRAELVQLDGEAFFNGEVKPTSKNPITLDSDSPLHERIAYSMAGKIGIEFNSGDSFYSTKQAMETFDGSQDRVRAALRLLKDNGLIDYRNGNPRQGYVVV